MPILPRRWPFGQQLQCYPHSSQLLLFVPSKVCMLYGLYVFVPPKRSIYFNLFPTQPTRHGAHSKFFVVLVADSLRAFSTSKLIGLLIRPDTLTSMSRDCVRELPALDLTVRPLDLAVAFFMELCLATDSLDFSFYTLAIHEDTSECPSLDSDASCISLLWYVFFFVCLYFFGSFRYAELSLIKIVVHGGEGRRFSFRMVRCAAS